MAGLFLIFVGFLLGMFVVGFYYLQTYQEAIERGIRDAERQYLTQEERDTGVHLVPMFGPRDSWKYVRPKDRA